MKQKLDFISLAYIFGSIFIVLVHSIPSFYVNPPHIFLSLKDLLAHLLILPMFFFCAGFLLNYNDSINKKGLKKYYLDKTFRLFIPYIILSFLYYLIHLYMFDINFSFKYFFNKLFYPREQSHLWFLLILYYYYIIWPVFVYALRYINKIIVHLFIIALFIIFTCFNFKISKSLFGYTDFFLWSIHFATGFVLCEYMIKYKDKWFKNLSLITCVICIILISFAYKYIENKIFVCGLFFVQLILIICYKNSNLINNKFIHLFKGKYFTIYLYHHVFIFIFSKILEDFLNFNFYLSVLFLWIASLILCLLLVKLFQKLNIKNKIVRSVLGL